MELEGIPEQCWRSFIDGARRSASAYRTAVVSSVGPHGPELRTVVLRHADEAHRSLVFFTDGRSGKVSELEKSGQAAWLFFDISTGIQIRARSRVSLHQQDEVARDFWSTVPQASRLLYAGIQASGERVDSKPVEYLADEEAFLNFLVVRCELTFLDWLRLRETGHLRARFSWDGKAWNSAWVTP